MSLIAGISAVDLIKNRKEVEDFYRGVLGSMSINAKRISVMPYTANNDASLVNNAAGILEYFYDLGSPTAPGFPMASFIGGMDNCILDGKLITVSYVNTGFTATNVSYSLQLVTRNGSSPIGFNRWQYQARGPLTAQDPMLNALNPARTVAELGFMNELDVMFNYLYLRNNQVGAGQSTVTVEWIFKGLKISYT